ncbi:MAG: preprotein translocase subunit SecG [Armatimonadetes bacterium]|nr:preprotein translocase subunit SecG [Armatimonadota bacterium]
MNTLVTILLWLLMAVSVVFVFVTIVFGSKTDAMSGGSSSIRTTFRGKPGFDDFMSRLTLIMGGVFMGLCLLINILIARTGS